MESRSFVSYMEHVTSITLLVENVMNKLLLLIFQLVPANGLGWKASSRGPQP